VRKIPTIIVAALLFPILVVAADISETNEVLLGEVSFYTQSNAGMLSTCAVEFNGIDKELNYFTGSYGFFYSEVKGPVPIFKIKSLKVSLEGTKQRNSIRSAWIKSDRLAAVGDNWVGDSEGDSFILVGKDVEEGAKLYADLIGGKVIKVGFLHAEGNIDRVYRLKEFQQDQMQEASLCFVELIDQFVNK